MKATEQALLRGLFRAILLVGHVVAGMAPVTCQTVANSDSLGGAGDAWKVELLKPDCQSNRSFLAPSAVLPKQGEGHFQTNLVQNSVSYGVSDRFTVGAMIGWLGVGLTAKAGWQVGKKTSVSMGVLGAADLFDQFRQLRLHKPLVLSFLNVTRSHDNKSVTVWVGATNTAFRPFWQKFSPGAPIQNGVYRPEYKYQSYPRALMMGISGMFPLTERISLITENHVATKNLFVKVVESPNNQHVHDYLSNLYTEGEDLEWRLSEDMAILSLGVRHCRINWEWEWGLAAVLRRPGRFRSRSFPLPWFSFSKEI